MRPEPDGRALRQTLGRTMRRLVAAAAALLVVGSGAALAGHLLGPDVRVSNADIVAALERVGFSQSFAQAGANASSKNENTTGQLALQTSGGSATGLWQMLSVNVQTYCPCTVNQLANDTLDQQAQTWGNYARASLQAGVMKQLNTMTTFDSQPVDDALRVACIQEGMGFCQQMVAAGSCGSFGAGNGNVSVCNYAARIRTGPGTIGTSTASTTAAQTTPTANTGNDTGASAQQDTNTRAIGGDSIPMGNPMYCWSCDAIIYGMAVAEAAITGGLPALLDTIFPLLVLAAACGILYRIMMGLVAGIDVIRYTLPTMLRAALVLSILSNGGAALQDILLNEVMIPVINGATGVGQAVATTLASSLGVTLDNITPNQGSPTTPVNDDCSFNQNGVTLTYLQPAEASAVSLGCTLHRAMTAEVQIGVFIANSNRNATGGMQTLGAIGVQVTGLLMTSIGVIGMLKFGLMFMDIMISMGVAMGFAPWSVYCWIFESTQISWTNLWRRFLHASLACVLAGIASVVSLMLLLTSMQAGVGGGTGATALSASDILVAAQQIVEQMDPNAPTSMAVAFRFMMFTICGGLAANHVLAQSQKMVTTITGLRVSDALSKAAFSSLSQIVGAGLGLSAGAAGALASPAGRILARAGAALIEE